MNPRTAADNHRRDFLLLLTLLVAFRLGSLWLLRPGGFLADFSDYYYYREFAALSDRGLYPYVNIWSPYPPIFPWLLVGLYRLSLLLPPWEQPQLIFDLLLGSVLIAAEAGTLALVYALADRMRGRAVALRSAVFYALLFLPAYTAQAHFDSLPTFLVMLALWLVLEQRWLLAGVAGGLGVMTKLLPALVFPVGLRRLAPELPRRWRGFHWGRGLRYLVAGGAAVIAVAAPFLAHNPRLLLAPLDIQRIRPPWQTIWALLDGYYGFGVAPADVRDLAALSGPAWDGRVPYGLLSLVLVAVYVRLYLARARWDRPRTAVAFTGLSFTLLFLLSKGWSPQYLLYLLPFVAVLWPDWRGVVLALSLTFFNYLESHGFFILLPGETWLLVLTTTARTGLLALLAGGLLLDYLDKPWPTAHLRRLAPWAGAAAGIALALLSWRLLDAYARSRYQVEPARPAIEYLGQVSEPGETLLFLRQPDLGRFYPHLHRRLALRTVDDRAPDGDLASHLDRQVVDLQPKGIWLVLASGDDSGLSTAVLDSLGRLAYLVGETEFAAYSLSHWIPRSALRAAQVRFADATTLVGWESTIRDDRLNLTLVWQGSAVANGLSVFVHLAGPDLRPLAQSDSVPAWSNGYVLDRHAIDLGGSSPETYRLLLGVYDPETGDRLLTAAGSDSCVLADVTVGPAPQVVPR